VQSKGTIYIFYTDGQRPFYELQPDPWEPGKPESDPTIDVPDGFYQPVRGFGLLWRNDEGLISNNVRERLGWAIEPEQGFDIQYFKKRIQDVTLHAPVYERRGWRLARNR
jgi:hypothetical protein